MKMSFIPALACLLHCHLFAQAPAEPAPPKPPEPVATTPAAPPPPPQPVEMRPLISIPQVCVDVLMISLPEEKALPLLPELRDPARIVAAQARLLEMVAQKQAAFVDWPQITTLSGNRAVSENIVEEKYPIEFAAPDLDGIVKAMNHKDGDVYPTTFETRNTGITLELEPLVSEDLKSVTMQLAPQIVRLIREKQFAGNTNMKGEKVMVPQPIFETHKVSTNITLRDGERMLLQVSKSVEPGSPVLLFIVGAKIIPGTAAK